MHPILLKFGRFEIFSYGVLLAISFLVGIYWGMARAEKRGIDRNHIMDLSIIIVLCAILGSRFLYVVTHLEEFHGRWLDTINPFQSTGEIGIAGLSMLGGVVFTIAAVIIFSRVKNISLLRLMDVLAPTFALGIFLTRIGCFLNGCCYGMPCELPWGMIFPLHSPAGSMFQGVHIHPTQLYASLYGLIILVVMYLLDRKPKFDGFMLSLFFMLYGTSRFLIDFVRYYEESVQMNIIGFNLTINQVISILMFVVGLALMLLLPRRQQSA